MLYVHTQIVLVCWLCVQLNTGTNWRTYTFHYLLTVFEASFICIHFKASFICIHFKASCVCCFEKPISNAFNFLMKVIYPQMHFKRIHFLYLAISSRAVGAIFRPVNIGLRDHKDNGIIHSVKWSPPKFVRSRDSTEAWSLEKWNYFLNCFTQALFLNEIECGFRSSRCISDHRV